MDNKEYFGKYRAKLVGEAILRSAILGLAIGFGVAFVAATVCFFTAFKAGVALSLGLGFGVAALAAVVLYFAVYRPTIQSAARRIDATGLDERVVTMLELENNDSYIARRQREDAIEHLQVAQSSAIKTKVANRSIVAASASFLAAFIMVLLTGLVAGGVLKPPIALADAHEGFFSISYTAGEGGMIEGELEQLVLPSENGTAVYAVADDGYEFDCWSDGVRDPYRLEKDLSEDLTLEAKFIRLEEGPGEGEGEGEGEGDGNGDSNRPGDGEGNGNGNGEGQGQGEGQGAGGQYESKNQIIDGDTYYEEDLEKYIADAEANLSTNDDLTDEQRELIETYLGSL